ncbi:putative fluoride ion transporter CrcB 1 [Catellatospora methionotrophica]|uniref:Fluoride-specific ion channel FluC n=1 Tax=Catellatospora methionotrophica TaxID=121620 RepID=A0A8J3PGC7_9ACTN|nr:fluoride efflux transporter CrcB [Catellatospora methionotrophica]GIG14111.1 putative fluoride ion transporter CrcB 1 [Catellatospora methionotrophica]
MVRRQWDVLAVISAGGVLGALARYAVSRALPPSPTGFPWGIFLVNVTGCMLIGVLMALVAHVWPGRRLLRPFLGTGVLGGYTTFSAYTVDIVRLADAGAATVAAAYLVGTLLVALPAVYGGMVVTRWLVRR